MPVTSTFQKSAAPRKRPAPFSLRLSESERARLIGEAAGAPLGAYIKAKLLDGPLPPPRRQYRSGASVVDRQALAQGLALLGSSRIASNLNQLAKAANTGSLPLTPETDALLTETLRDVRAIRTLLIDALGLKADTLT